MLVVVLYPGSHDLICPFATESATKRSAAIQLPIHLQFNFWNSIECHHVSTSFHTEGTGYSKDCKLIPQALVSPKCQRDCGRSFYCVSKWPYTEVSLIYGFFFLPLRQVPRCCLFLYFPCSNHANKVTDEKMR